MNNLHVWIHVILMIMLLGAPSRGEAKWVKKGRMAAFTSPLSRLKVHPFRYVASQGEYKKRPQVYDLRSSTLQRVPRFEQLRGVSKEPSLTGPGNIRVRLRRAKLTGKYFTYGPRYLYYFDHSRRIGAYYVQVTSYLRTVKGAPRCGGGVSAALIQSEQRWYCRNERRFLAESSYLRTLQQAYLYLFDTVSGSVTRRLLLGEGTFNLIGADPAGKVLYLGETRVMVGKTVVKGPVRLLGVDLSAKTVSTLHTLPLPPRKKHPGAYAVSWVPSVKYGRFFVYEFDEKLPRKSRGWLRSPYPRGAVIDLAARAHFTFEAPVEVWAAAFTPKGDRLYINSYQKGEITVVDCLKKRRLTTRTGVKFTYLSAISPKGKYLYNFHSKGLTVYALPSLRQAGSMSKARLLGASWTTSGQWYGFDSGRSVIVGLTHKDSAARMGTRTRYFAPFRLLK